MQSNSLMHILLINDFIKINMINDFSKLALITKPHNGLETVLMECPDHIQELVDSPFIYFVPLFVKDVQP